jgi:Flp pilus assembly protein TadD
MADAFAVHPLHVESVAWVSERKDVLSTLFWILVLWQYFKYVRQPQRSRYVPVLILFALGLMAKPMLVTLPFVLILMDVWPLGRVSPTSGFRAQRAAYARLVREKLPFFALSAAMSIVTFIVQKQAGAVRMFDAVPPALRVENAIVSYVAYLGAMIWPTGLAALYPIPRSIPLSSVAFCLLVLIGISVAAIRLARRHPYFPVGWMWYLVTLAPVIGLIQVGDQSRADRYMYIPSIGLSVLVAWGRHDAAGRRKHIQTLLAAAGGAALLAYAVAGNRQVHYWKDTISLWTRALEVTDNKLYDRAHNYLGDELMKLGRYGEAAAHYSESLRIRPDYANAHRSLGDAYSGEGRYDDAIAQYDEALRLKPGVAVAHHNLANALLNRDRIGEAAVHFAEAARLEPTMAEAHNGLGIALFRQGRVDDAIREVLESLRLKPSTDTHYNAGMVLAGKADIAGAVRHFRAALELDPNNAQARTELERLSNSRP